MSVMSVRNNVVGAVNALLLPLVFAVVFFLGAAGFGAWAFMEREDYKSNSDQKAEAAVAVATKQTESNKENEFIEREKEPLKDYLGPSQFGSIVMKYPKTWSGYVNFEDSEGELFFHPGVVTGGEGKLYATHISVVSSRYEEVVEDYSSQIEEGTAKASAYKLPKMKNIVGIKVTGTIDDEKQGTVIILPLRDKTIKIAIESNNYLGDFNKIILANFTYSP